MIEQRRVDAAKIGGVDGIAVDQIRKIRRRAVNAGIDARAKQKYGAGGAVVGAAAGVFRRTSAELRIMGASGASANR